MSNYITFNQIVSNYMKLYKIGIFVFIYSLLCEQQMQEACTKRLLRISQCQNTANICTSMQQDKGRVNMRSDMAADQQMTNKTW